MGTVSNVINHPERVSKALRERVEAVMVEEKYLPHPLARALSLGRNKMIATILFDISNPFFAEMSHCIDRDLQVRGYSLMVSGTDQSAELEAKVIKLLVNAGAEAIAICGTGSNTEQLLKLQDYGLPIMIFAQRSEDPRIPFVTVDDRQGMRSLGEHLIGKGVESFYFIHEPVNAIQHRDRYDGFMESIYDHGLDDSCVRLVTSESPSWDGGYGTAKNLLSERPDELPECFVCLNDYTALGVCRALTQAGLKVGDDILVTGFDDIPYAALLESPLTTIKQPIEEMSKYLIGEVINAIENRTISMNSHTFKAELVVRESA